MSDEHAENEEPVTREQLVAMLNDQELLDEYGYRITPKGYMALVLMELGVPNEAADVIAQKMSDRIFLAGFTYLDEQQLGLNAEAEDDAV